MESPMASMIMTVRGLILDHSNSQPFCNQYRTASNQSKRIDREFCLNRTKQTGVGSNFKPRKNRELISWRLFPTFDNFQDFFIQRILPKFIIRKLPLSSSSPIKFRNGNRTGDVDFRNQALLLSRVSSSSLMANPHRSASYGGAVPYRSREGLSTRVVSNNPDEIQLRIDPMQADLDDEITGLRGKLSKLKSVAQEIDTETKYQNDFITQLQMTVIKAQAGVKNNVRRLNKSIIQQGSNHVFHVILFALFCFFLVYLWSKFSRR